MKQTTTGAYRAALRIRAEFVERVPTLDEIADVISEETRCGELEGALRGLMDWDAFLGKNEAPCWERARRALRLAEEGSDQ